MQQGRDGDMQPPTWGSGPLSPFPPHHPPFLPVRVRKVLSIPLPTAVLQAVLLSPPDDEFLLQADRHPIPSAQSRSCLCEGGNALEMWGKEICSKVVQAGRRGSVVPPGMGGRPRSRASPGELCPVRPSSAARAKQTYPRGGVVSGCEGRCRQRV